MSITRISVAELRSRMRDFTPEEKARLDALSDEEIERRALADPDAQPSTPEMMRRGQAGQRHRLFFEGVRAGLLGASLSEAEPGLDLPLWEVTDRDGHKVYMKAADVRRVEPPADPGFTIVSLDAVAPASVRASRTTDDAGDAPAGVPEKQTT